MISASPWKGKTLWPCSTEQWAPGWSFWLYSLRNKEVKRPQGQLLIKPSGTNYLHSSAKCSSKASSVVPTFWALIIICKCSQHTCEPGKHGTRPSEVENLPVRSFSWRLPPGDVMKDKGRISTMEFQILLGKNTDKYLKLNYVMATSRQVDITSHINIELEKSKIGWGDEEMAIA